MLSGQLYSPVDLPPGKTCRYRLNRSQGRLRSRSGRFRAKFLTLSRNVITIYLCFIVPNPLLVATKDIGLEVNADKTKYMVMFLDRNAGLGHS